MCIALVKKPDGVVTKERLRECWDRNRDGAGFAYVYKGNVIISKGLMTFDEFYKAYSEAVATHPESVFLIHFRIATSGDKGKSNTHPFSVGDGTALIHNGILFSPPNAKRSDTNIFSEWLSKRLPDKQTWLANKEKVEELIGNYNKLALLFKDGTFLICNEMKGEWSNNVWYSNTYSFSSGTGWTGVSNNWHNRLQSLIHHQGNRSIN